MNVLVVDVGILHESGTTEDEELTTVRNSFVLEPCTGNLLLVLPTDVYKRQAVHPSISYTEIFKMLPMALQHDNITVEQTPG